MKRLTFFSLLVLLLCQTACFIREDWGETREPGDLPYYTPIYASNEQAFLIQTLESRPMHNPGRIYLKGALLIVNERGKGFHFFNNADPKNPIPLLFLAVPGAQNMAMQGQYLYADNVTDLITLDLTNLQQIKEVDRKKNVFKNQQLYPPNTQVAFECVDAKKGTIVGWKETENPGNPGCWR